MVETKFFLPVILGTARQGRQSEKAAKFVLEKAKVYGFETQLVDVSDYNLGVTGRVWETNDPKSRAWQDIAKKADGFIIVTPEYNHGYPGELKMLLDQLYEEYDKKPAAVCGVSSGPMGGVRAIEQLRLVLIEFGMLPCTNAVYFSNAADLFDKQGNIQAERKEFYEQRIKTLFDELNQLARATKSIRK